MMWLNTNICYFKIKEYNFYHHDLTRFLATAQNELSWKQKSVTTQTNQVV